MAKSTEKMTERELLAIVDNEISNSLGRMDTRLSSDRLQAMKYYMGEKEGNLAPPESEGRSTVVSNDVSDTIEWILPSLMRIFTSGDDAVEYEATQPEDEPMAKQATSWANYVFYKQNPGFLILHNWLKDALLQKLGIIKVWWDDSQDITTEEYKGITLTEMTIMLQDGTVEVTEKTQLPPEEQTQMGQTTVMTLAEPMYDIKVKRTKDSSKTCIENVPPEEFMFSRKARDSKRIFSCHHKVLRTVTELKEAGYNNTDELMSDDSGAEFSQEAVERQKDTNEFTYGTTNQSADETMRFVWITESYLQVDWNGDGLAEWRKVVKSGKVLLDNEEIDEHPFCMITPILMPHKLVGRSIADLVMDIADIKTALMRQFIDNMYLQNNPRLYVDESKKVNIDDLLDSRVGGIVRGNGENGVTPLMNAPLSPYTFSLLEYMDSIKENRTGVTKYNQGLDANSLNKTATGINAIMNAAQQRVELIARVCAETGIKDMFRKILKLSSQYQKKQQMFRLDGQYVPIDPRAWKTQYDISINVGLGTGNKDQIAAHIMNIMNVQKEAMMGGLPIVTPKNIYNSASKLVINSGFKSATPFFTDPESEEGKAFTQQASQKPNPEMVKVQQQGQADAARMQQETAQQQHAFQLQQAQLLGELKLKSAELMGEMQAEHEKTMASVMIKREEAVAKAQTEAAAAAAKGEPAPEPRPDHFALIAQQLEAQNQQNTQALGTMLQGIQQMVAASLAPKQVVRGPDGRVNGVQTAMMPPNATMQ